MEASYPRCSIKFTTAQVPIEFRSGSLDTFPYSSIPPTLTLFFLYEQDKHPKNIRSSDSWVTSLHRLSAWSCPATAWRQGCFVCGDLSRSGSSMMLRYSGNAHFLPAYKLLPKLLFSYLRHSLCDFQHFVMQRFTQAALKIMKVATLGLGWKTVPWGQSSHAALCVLNKVGCILVITSDSKQLTTV